MIVGVATSNPVKIRAVRGVFGRRARVVAVRATGAAPPQPVSIGQIVKGAISRASQAKKGADLGVGIEAGLFRLAERWFNVTIAAVTDGKRTSLGGGPFFEMPERLARAIAKSDDEVGKYFAGRGAGAIGAVTGGRMTREEATRAALLMALAPWTAKRLYRTR